MYWDLSLKKMIIWWFSHSLGSFEGGCIRPQQLDPFAVLKHQDVLSAHLQSHPQLLVGDAKTPKVSVDFTIGRDFLVSDDLAIH